MMPLPDALLVLALSLWCAAIIRAIVFCLDETDGRGARRSTSPRRWLAWPLTLVAHYLAPLLALRARLRAIGSLRRAGLAGVFTVAEWFALRLWSAAVALLVAVIVAINGRVDARSAIALLCLALCSGWWLPALLLRMRARGRLRTMLRELPGYRDRLAVASDCGCRLPEALHLAIQWGRRGPMQSFMSALLADVDALLSTGRPRRVEWPPVPGAVAAFGAELLRACTAASPAGYAYPAPRMSVGASPSPRDSNATSSDNYLINEELYLLDPAADQRPGNRLQRRLAGTHRRYPRAPPV